jgi:hypothetical protein
MVGVHQTGSNSSNKGNCEPGGRSCGMQKATKKASKFSGRFPGRQAAAPGSVRASRRASDTFRAYGDDPGDRQKTKQQNRKRKEEKKLKKRVPCHCLSRASCLRLLLPAIEYGVSVRKYTPHHRGQSVSVSCLCHLPLQTSHGDGIPRDSIAYNTEHQVITTAPYCVVDSVRRLLRPCAKWPAVGVLWGIRAAPRRWQSWRRTLDFGARSGGDLARFSTWANALRGRQPLEPFCRPAPDSALSCTSFGPRIVPAARRQGPISTFRFEALHFRGQVTRGQRNEASIGF